MIIITGASKGIGRFLFERFSNEGQLVVGTYNSTIDHTDKLYKVDISNYESCQQLFLKIKDQLRDIVLINCAGISYTAVTHKSDPERWSRVIDVNIVGTYNMIRTVLPIMREQGYGRIINFASVVAQRPTMGVSAYAASKAALIGMTKSIAIENSSFNITVNTINLGYSNIGMGINEVPETYRQEMLNQIPKKRFCQPEEIYNTIKYLIETEYITGSGIDINGGIY